jgi:pyruvate/2-oxoglutarate/acetoin dehydrogenase E1 component
VFGFQRQDHPFAGPVIWITTPQTPRSAADKLDDYVWPSVDKITETVRKALEA